MQWYRKYLENSRCTRWYKIEINIVLSSHPTHPSHPSYARHPSYPSHASHSIHVHTVRTGSLLTVIVFSPFRYVSSIIFFYLWRPALELNGLPYVNKVLLYFTLLFRRKSRTYEKNNDSIYDKVWESQSAWDKSITDKVMVSLDGVFAGKVNTPIHSFECLLAMFLKNNGWDTAQLEGFQTIIVITKWC